MKAAVRRPSLLNLDYRQQFVSIPADAFTGKRDDDFLRPQLALETRVKRGPFGA